jgi:hypothetical protein
MINCRKCSFVVDAGMRHSLVKNCCPSCGSALLGDVYARRLDLFKQRVLEQEFSHGLDDDKIFDVALFMLTEFFPVSNDNEGEQEEGEPLDEGEPSADLKEISYEDIRSEVRTEVLSDLDEDPESLDLDLKVARLKRLAKEKSVRNTGPAVRRLSGD